MKNEIKEILEYLKDDKKISFGSFGTVYKRIELNDIKLLLDYITNLQEEIEILNNIINELKEKLNNTNKYMDTNIYIEERYDSED